MAEARKPGRPATGKTPTRSMRLGDSYDRAKTKAEANGETITAVVDRLLGEYADQPDNRRSPAMAHWDNEYGTLTDYTTGEQIRPATADEHARSLAGGDAGAFDLDGRAVFVAGGPETVEPRES
jgi:hypothetical protein